MFLRKKSGPQSSGAVSADVLLPLVSVLLVVMAGMLLGQLIVAIPGPTPVIILAAAFVFVVAFFRMDAALVFIILAMLLSPEISVGSVPKRNIAIRLEDILILILGVAWLARSAVFKVRDIVPRTPINGYVGFYCACFLISTMQAIVVLDINPLKAFFYALKYLEYFILYFIVAGTVTNRKQYGIYVFFLFLTFFVVNLYAASQIGHVDRVSAPFEGKEGEPNTLGGYQVLLICTALGLFCHLSSWRARWGVMAMVLVSLVPFMHTLSRASFMAIVPAYLSLIFMARSRRREALFIALILVIVLAMLFLPDSVRDRIMYTFNARPQEGIRPVEFMGFKLDPSTSSRWWDWWEAVEYWKAQPLFGYGLGGRSFLDSQYVNNLVELGAAGFLAFAALIFSLHRAVARVYRTTADELVRGLALGFLAGNIGMLVHALTANTFILIRVMEPYWFLAALILAWPRIEAGLLMPPLPVPAPGPGTQSPGAVSGLQAVGRRGFRNMDLIRGQVTGSGDKGVTHDT